MTRYAEKLSGSTKTNFYLNLLNVVPFLILISSGILLQLEYHMHHQPDEHLIAGLNRSGWLLLHRITAALSLVGITAHCILHRKFIAATTRRILDRRSMANVHTSYYLLILCIPTVITGMASWIALNGNTHARLMLVEIHDKLALLMVAFSLVHIVSRAGWMLKTYQRLRLQA